MAGRAIGLRISKARGISEDTENESNAGRLWGQPNPSPYVKDAFHENVIAGKKDMVTGEDGNDAERLAQDPTFRLMGSERGVRNGVANSQTGVVWCRFRDQKGNSGAVRRESPG